MCARAVSGTNSHRKEAREAPAAPVRSLGRSELSPDEDACQILHLESQHLPGQGGFRAAPGVIVRGEDARDADVERHELGLGAEAEEAIAAPFLVSLLRPVGQIETVALQDLHVG